MVEKVIPSLSLILHDIRSAHNVGSIFRTSDATGVGHIYITGYTPHPYDGSLPYTTKPERGIIKTALGAQEYVPWSVHESLEELMGQLHCDGVHIVGLEQSQGSIDYRAAASVPRPLALLLGNEPRGIDPDHLAACDTVLEIPMHGKKQSLNVSVAVGVALYELINTPA